MDSEAKYIQVILPLRLKWLPWYTCGEPLEPGVRVRVVLARKEYVGVVDRVCDRAEIDAAQVRPVVSVERGLEPISAAELRLWHFIADYYLCSIGEVYKFAYPAILRSVEMKKARCAIAPAPIAAACRSSLDPAMSASVDAALALHKPLLLRGGDSPLRRSILDVLISRTLRDGRSVLYMVPDKIESESAASHLAECFGDRLLTCNSGVSHARRRNIASALRSAEPYVVLGTRVSVFLPFSRLGLVIIDDEQEVSYKQDSPTPRYNGRDTAVMLASIHGADTLLCTATPSLESIYNVRCGRYSEVIIPENLARLTVIDISAEARKKAMDGEMSFKLLNMIAEAGKAGRQVVTLSPLNIPEFRRQELRPDALVAFIQADLMLGRDDFRADERMLQFIGQIRRRCSDLVVQTRRSDHPVFSASDPSVLLEERRQFKLPPYTRLVDIIARKGEEQRIVERITLTKDSTLQSCKRGILERYSDEYLIDVDPL